MPATTGMSLSAPIPCSNKKVAHEKGVRWTAQRPILAALPSADRGDSVTPPEYS